MGLLFCLVHRFRRFLFFPGQARCLFRLRRRGKWDGVLGLGHFLLSLFFLGCGPAPALHADNFTFDEAILAKGSAFWKALAAAF